MKHVLRAIDRGETVTVLYRGKARARLTPITPATGSPAPKTKDYPSKAETIFDTDVLI